jgi:hypothetical protein
VTGSQMSTESFAVTRLICAFQLAGSS